MHRDGTLRRGTAGALSRALITNPDERRLIIHPEFVRDLLMKKSHQRYHERRIPHRRGISKQVLMIYGAKEINDIKICDDDPVARIAASVNELRQKPRQRQAIGLAPIAIMLGTKSQFIQHKIVEHATQDVHRLMGDPERAERLDQGSWFVPTPVYYAYHHIRVDSKLVHFFA